MTSKKSLFAVVVLLSAAVLGPATASAQEKYDNDPKHQLPKPEPKAADIKKPVKVLILMGQSNMVGMGEVAPLRCWPSVG